LVKITALRRIFLQSLVGLVCVFSIFIPCRPVAAETGGAYDLINAVNALRVAKGLPAYTINAALMAAAQGHVDWIATTGQG
jgi:hypothetical protein